MTRNERTRARAREPLGKLVLTLGATLCTTLALGLTSAVAAGPNVPYDLPVSLPSSATGPPVDAAAPYTPAVLNVLAQLEASPMTPAKIQNVDTLLHDGANTNCHNVGPVGGPVGNDASGSPTATTLAGNLTALFTNVDPTHITVASATGLAVGQTLYVDAGVNADSGVISAISGTTITFAAPLAHVHGYGVPVTNDAAYSGAGQTFHNIKVTSVTGFTAGQTIWIDNMSNAEQVTIANVGTPGAGGTGLDLTGPITKVHPTGAAVFTTFTTPSVTKICWTDAQGVLNTSGNNARGSTGPMTLMGLGASFDRGLANAWGQTEGRESREFMVTGMFGPQTDLDRLPNWGRNLTTTGEDPYLSHEFIASQIEGMQGVGAMSQMKHFVVYNGQNQNANTDIQDQSLHELYLTPYEGGFVSARAAATMCSYQIWRDTSTNPALVDPISALASGPSPFANAGENPQTWPLNESHFSCEHPLSLNHVLRGTWGSAAFVGSDYPATHSTSAITNGMDQEMPTQNGFLAGGNGTSDPTGSTCAYYVGNPGGFTPGLWDPNCTSDSAHIGGIPNGFQGGPVNAGCPAPTAQTGAGATGGCTLNAAVAAGLIPLSVFNQSAARILYQLERFGMLGCDPTPGPTCTNPGGVGGDRTGTANLPDGPSAGAPVLGTKNGDAAIVERYSEEGATLLKNDGRALPLTSADLAGGVFVTGSSANHTVADPTNEASTGFIGRNAVNPLQQLKALSGNPGAFTFFPANDPDGAPISPSQLSTTNDASGLGGLSLSIDGGPPTKDTNPIDHTAVNGNRLAPGHVYTWSGYLYVPTTDTYTFAIQQSDTLPTTLNCPQTGQFMTPPSTPTLTMCSAFTAANASQTNTPPDAVQFGFNGAQRNLNAVTANVYGATVPSNPTNAGYTDQGLISRTCATGTAPLEPGTANCTTTESNLTGGTFYPVSFTVNTNQCVSTPPAANAGTNPGVQAVLAPCGPTSVRLAVTRAAGDIADAAAMAAGKSKAIVFVNTGSGTSNSAVSPPGTPYDGHTISAVTAMSAANVSLIQAVAAANPNTVVVINSDNPGRHVVVGIRQVDPRDVVRRPGGRHLDCEDPARAGQPERAHRPHVAGQQDGHDLGLQRAGERAVPRLDRRPASRAAEQQRRLLRHRQPGLASVPGRRRHERVGGHLHRLPLPRQARDHARLPVRLRPLVHDLRVLEAEGRQGEGRRPRRQAQAREHGRRGRRRRRPGVRRAAERPACRRPIRRAVARAVRARRARSGPVEGGQAARQPPGALVLVRREAAVGARRRRPHALRGRRRRDGPPAAADDAEAPAERGHDLLQRADQRHHRRRQPPDREGRLVRPGRRDRHRQPPRRQDERDPARARRRLGQRRHRSRGRRGRSAQREHERDLLDAPSATTSSSTRAPRVRRGASVLAGRTRSATTSTSITTEAATTSRATRSGTT